MKRITALVAVALIAAGCGSAARSGPPSAPAVAPAALGSSGAHPPLSHVSVAACRRSSLPARYAADPAHSGGLNAHTYSASADVQAALEYDQLKAGSRKVFIRHAAGAAARVDGVVSCVALRFPSAHLAARFFGSYRELRRDAGSIVRRITPASPIRGVQDPVAYFEKKQSFRGYRIASTNVVEAAGLANDTLFIASVAGASPSVQLARTLLTSAARSS
jgi:hypothetical protein